MWGWVAHAQTVRWVAHAQIVRWVTHAQNVRQVDHAWNVIGTATSRIVDGFTRYRNNGPSNVIVRQGSQSLHRE